GHILLFSGHISNGNISLLQNIDYTELYRKVTFTNYDHPKYKKCFYLNKGKYTVVCLMLKDNPRFLNLLPCENINSRIVINPIPICSPFNNIEPQYALKLNDNKGVFDPLFTADGLNFQHELTICTDCKSHSNFKPVLSCANT